MPIHSTTKREPAAMPSRAVSDAKFIGHDGAIWPRERAAMTTPRDIAQRMAEDIARSNPDGIEVITYRGHLEACGWTRRQLALCLDRARILRAATLTSAEAATDA